MPLDSPLEFSAIVEKLPGAVSGRQEVKTFQDGQEHARVARNMPGWLGIYQDGKEYAGMAEHILGWQGTYQDGKEHTRMARNMPR